MEAARLCFRCEIRARWLETGAACARRECERVLKSVTRCRSFRPVRPLVLRARGRIPLTVLAPPAAALEVEGRETGAIEIGTVRVRGGLLVYWRPRRRTP